ncbi:MAG: ribonuclease H family protein [Pseudomonadales bacterium]
MAKKKFYVVWVGKQTGVFTDWSVVQPLVAGYPGAKHKSYPSMEDAKKALDSGAPAARLASTKPGTKKKPSTKKKPQEFVLDKAYDIHIFSDGACDPNPGEAGSGVAVYERGLLSELWYGCYEPLGTNNTAELNALYKALEIAEKMLSPSRRIQILSDSSYSVNAMTKWSVGWEKNGWARKGNQELANKELIASMYSLYKRLAGNVVLAHVKGHSGVEGNELADRLSLMAHREKIAGFQMFDGVSKKEELLSME